MADKESYRENKLYNNMKEQTRRGKWTDEYWCIQVRSIDLVELCVGFGWILENPGLFLFFLDMYMLDQAS